MTARALRRGAVPRRILAALLGMAALTALWDFAPRGAPPPPPPLSADLAQIAARRAEAAFADAQALWAELFRAELGRDYAPAELRHFSRTTPSICAGTVAAAGPFYCAATRIVATDLAFLDALGGRLRQDAQRGAAVFVARIVAAHVEAELDSAGSPSETAETERADCLAGVWAHHAAPRIGAVSPDLYGRMLTSAREVAAEAGT
ncbi:MAG: neutral zinc metallopeptidase, partial [Rhodobacteraceae bacterium]|nr:neutral zinc metallopeptidase [Paracoccaceae bacterium]